MREVRLPQDRAAALAVVSRRLASDVPGYTPHPGELDWWWYHRDPDEGRCVTWFDQDAVVHVEPDGPSTTVIADDSWLSTALTVVQPDTAIVEMVATRDPAREHHLAALGLAPSGRVLLELHHPLDPLSLRTLPDATVAPGWRVTTMAHGVDVDSRADAARLAFRTELAPAEHRARYRSFTASPGYVPSRDVVAVDDDGRVGSFCQWWADPSGVAQVEPMGTLPQVQRTGLGRAVLGASLRAAAEEGMTVMRVLALEGYFATDFYLACGFAVVDRLRDWVRPG